MDACRAAWVRFPVVTVALLAGAAVATFAGPAETSPWLLRPSQWSAAPWTLWTGHLVHFSPAHLRWDALVVGILGARLELRWGARGLGLGLGVVAPLLSLGLVFASPELAGVGGLSGLAVALYAATIADLRGTTAHGGLLASVAVVLFGLKLAFECLDPSGGVFVGAMGENVQTLPWAHVLGFLLGGPLGWLWRVKRAGAVGGTVEPGRKRAALRS